MLCHAATMLIKHMQTIEYLSRKVKQDTGGNDLLITHLNDMLVSKMLNEVGSLACGKFLLMENEVKTMAVMRKMINIAFNK